MTEFSLHHVGVAVADVNSEATRYVETFGYTRRTDVIHDAVQTAFVQFLSLEGSTTYLELVAPDGASSKLAGAISRGGGLNHLCYSAANLDAACFELRQKGLILLQAPVPAVAFNRRVAWMVGKDKVLIELIERGSSNEL
jgi:methylmalonyl-CoA/ethylmalonyl-CoA epimerase